MGNSEQSWRVACWQQIRNKQQETLMQGKVLKQSKHLKDWRTRHILLTSKMILAFKDGKAEPTAVIMLSDINSVSKDHDSKYSYLVCRKILQIIVLKDNREHSIKSESDTDIDAWYKAVNKARMADFNKDSSIYGSYILNPDQQPTFINIELQQHF